MLQTFKDANDSNILPFAIGLRGEFSGVFAV